MMGIVYILDRRGSMMGLEEDSIRGFNAMLDKRNRLKTNVNQMILDRADTNIAAGRNDLAVLL